MSSNAREKLESWLKTIDVNGKVLDIGSSQLGIRKRLKSLNGDIVGADLYQPHEGERQSICIDLNKPIDFI